MKYVGWILGIVFVAGAAFAGYYYGSGQFNSDSKMIAEDNADNDNDNNDDVSAKRGSDLDGFDIYHGEDYSGSEPVSTYIGPTSVRISSPKNGEVILIDNPFTVSGTVSPNAKDVTIFVYETSFWDGLGSPVREKNIDEYKLANFKLGDSTWTYKVAHEFENVNHGAQGARYVARATFTDNTFKESEISVTYMTEMAEMGKPVVYLYPEKPTLVSVNVAPTDGISISEPAIYDGWHVLANPDGRLINSDGTVWPYLFWEGFASDFVTPKEGFVIAASEVDSFFNEKLALLGMNKQETADFKEFWVPRMQDKPYYFVSFIKQDIFDAYAPLSVTPKPDTVIRVFFDHKGLDERIEVPTQTLTPAPARDGFVVIEWGGRLYR